MKEEQKVPRKLYYRIGEVSKIIGVDTHTIRYWESQFKNFIRPERTKSNQRRYTQKDIENIKRIKELLYKKGFTIEGARKRLLKEAQQVKREEKFEKIKDNIKETIDVVNHIKEKLEKLKNHVLSFSNPAE